MTRKVSTDKDHTDDHAKHRKKLLWLAWPPHKRRICRVPITNYTREELISICEAALVPISKWSNRDTPAAQEQLGRCTAMLKCGAEALGLHVGDLRTDDRTIWVNLNWPSFADLEYGRREFNSSTDTFYLPTRQRLAEANGGDWY